MIEIQRLKARHREVARMMVSGMTIEEIHLSTGYSKSWLYNLVRTPLFVSMAAELAMEADKSMLDFKARFSAIRNDALDAVGESVHSDTRHKFEDAIRLKSAFDILDRTDSGFKVPDKLIEVNTNINVENLSDAEVELRLRKLKAIDVGNGGGNGNGGDGQRQEMGEGERPADIEGSRPDSERPK